MDEEGERLFRASKGKGILDKKVGKGKPAGGREGWSRERACASSGPLQVEGRLMGPI